MDQLQKRSPSVKQQSNDIFSKDLSIAGLSSVTINNTIYIYGGQTFDTNIWAITAKDVSNDIPPSPLVSRQNNRGSDGISNGDKNWPNLRYAPGVSVDSDSILVISGGSTTPRSNGATLNDTQLLIYSFDLKLNKTWDPVQLSSNASIPSARRDFTATAADKDAVYLFGGRNTVYSAATNTTPESTMQNDFWVYYTKYFLWEKLMSPYNNTTTRCGHTASMLGDGRMVIIGGYFCNSNQQANSVNNSLALTTAADNLNLIPMDQVLVYDTKSTKWIDPPQVNGTIPRPRTYHSAVVMNSNSDIFICGGQNGVMLPFQAYLRSQSGNLEDMTAILDTNTWNWRVPASSYANQPYPQSHALLSIVNETKLVFGFGVNYHTVYDHFRTFDATSESWESSSAPGVSNGNILIDGSGAMTSRINNTVVWIVMGCIGFAVLLSYIVAIWTFGFKKLHQKFLNSLELIKREIWKPRVGEPRWAEASRLVLKLVFLLLFVYLISTLTHQVIHSPIIDQLSYENNAEMTVGVPDIKFCFNNWIGKVPYIRCATDFGAQCSDYITQLPTEGDFEDMTGNVCFLFRAPSTFKLGQTTGRLESNGSFLKFDYYYNSGNIANMNSKSGQVQVDVYNKLHDPTIAIYQLNNDILNVITQAFEWNDGLEYDMYRYPDSKGIGSRTTSNKNSYRVTFGKTSTINFELIKRVTLNTNVWNYIGIASSVTTRYEIETAETPEFFSTIYDPSSGAPQPLGSIHVVPLNCQTKVLREQKAFAFINAMGIFGGLFGLLFSLQSCLFGYRPRSPWGYMHRWSFGHLRSSLMRGLQANFFPNAFAADYNRNDFVFQQQQQQESSKHIISMSNNQQLPPDTLSISMNNNTTMHPLSIDTKIISTPGYLLPVSPTIAFTVDGNPKDEKEIRMALIEDRIHMLERLFQAYYIDDEIFRSLDHALKNDTSLSSSSSTSFSSTMSDSVMESGRKRK